MAIARIRSHRPRSPAGSRPRLSGNTFVVDPSSRTLPGQWGLSESAVVDLPSRQGKCPSDRGDVITALPVQVENTPLDSGFFLPRARALALVHFLQMKCRAWIDGGLAMPQKLLLINESGFDRLIRVLLGVAVLSLLFVGPQTAWGWLGLVPLATGIIGNCPAYALFGLSTCSEESSRVR